MAKIKKCEKCERLALPGLRFCKTCADDIKKEIAAQYPVYAQHGRKCFVDRRTADQKEDVRETKYGYKC